VAIDRKYGRVEMEWGRIGADEPVVVFRARDKLLPKVLDAYLAMCELAGSPWHHQEIVRETRADILAWQEVNETRVPSSDHTGERLSAKSFVDPYLDVLRSATVPTGLIQTEQARILEQALRRLIREAHELDVERNRLRTRLRELEGEG
jgi:hypothetical protein